MRPAGSPACLRPRRAIPAPRVSLETPMSFEALVEILRGGRLESVHSGALAVVETSGRQLAATFRVYPDFAALRRRLAIAQYSRLQSMPR